MNIIHAQSRDSQRWDDYVNAHPEGSPYHRYAWKAAMAQAYGLGCDYYIALDNDDRIAGVMPTAKVPGLARRKLCALPYCDLGAPLADSSSVADALVEAALASAGPGTTLELRASQTTEQADPEPGSKVRMILELPPSADALFEGFKLSDTMWRPDAPIVSLGLPLPTNR